MFKSIIQNVPAAICGLALGTFTLSHTLFHIHFTELGLITLLLGSLCLVLFFLKLIYFPNALCIELHDSNTFAIMPALPMGLMTLASILKSQFHIDNLLLTGLWIGAVLLHIILMLWFIMYFIIKHRTYPNTSWFVMFVGIGVIGETASTFYARIGIFAIDFSSVLFWILLAFILFERMWHYYPKDQLPMAVIISAPASLCLNAYLSYTESLSVSYIMFYFVIAQFLFVFSIIFLPQIIEKRFKPAYAALTFPWAVTAASTYQLYTQLDLPGISQEMLGILASIEIVFAGCVIVWVYFRYIKHLFNA
ncbi:TDT family transporter [Staphylococcus simulans]